MRKASKVNRALKVPSERLAHRAHVVRKASKASRERRAQLAP